MDRKLKSLVASSIVIAVILGLVVPVQAPHGLNGTVYNPDGTPAEGVLVTATNLDTGSSDSDTTDVFGWYYIPLSFGTGNHVKIVATKGNLYAEKTVVCIGDTLELDLTLQAAVPALTPVGLIVLISMLSAIAAVAIVRKRR